VAAAASKLKSAGPYSKRRSRELYHRPGQGQSAQRVEQVLLFGGPTNSRNCRKTPKREGGKERGQEPGEFSVHGDTSGQGHGECTSEVEVKAGNSGLVID